MSTSARRRAPAHGAALGAALLVLALAAAGCGSDAKATDDPTTTASTSGTPTPTVTATPTPTTAPLSPFEGKAPVKAARAWAAAYAKAVNAGDRSMRAVQPIATAQGLAATKAAAADDFAHHYLQPGPEPFTPVSVQVRGNQARINLCLVVGGWSVDRKTHKPSSHRSVAPTVFNMVRVGGRWKFDSGTQGTADCAGVKVAGVEW